VARVDRQPWRLDARGRRWFDLVLAGGLLLPVPLTVVPLGVTSALLSLVQIAPLALRRRWPVRAFAAVAAASALQAALIDEPTWGQVAFPVAVYSVARYSRAVPAALALAVGFCGAAVASYDWLSGFDELGATAFVSHALFISAIAATAWALGTLGRTRAAYVATLVERGEQIRREAEQQVELAATAERARIAREMHDVVAHGLSVIVVQADGARYAAAQDPEVAGRTLETIAATGREALTEMRRMLGLLRAGEETGTRPQPGLPDLDALVSESRAAGMTIDAHLPDHPLDVSDGAALTAYRVVQEALSNVRKHAGPDVRTELRLLVGDRIEVLVEDDGRGASVVDDGRGLGLVGMRERVAVHGGTLDVGPRPGGGYRVSARLPR
jgi:signal transduction histidine kinase